MEQMPEISNAKLLTLWPKLGPAFRVLRDWDHRGGIIFISADDQGLSAARDVAIALAGKTIELATIPSTKAGFQEQVGKFLDGSVANEATLFDSPGQTSADHLCVIIPRIDKQPTWLHGKIKGCCERAPRPFVLLLTCPDLDWMPSYLRGHLYECRKKGASLKEAGKTEANLD